MQFNVLELLREGYGSFREFEIDDDARIDGELHHLTGRARFDRVPHGIFVRARLHGTGEGECSRCLEPATFPIDMMIEEQYIPTLDPVTGGHVRPPEGEEDAYRINERHMIDLTLPVQQYWEMAQPIAPICREDCAGICPLCGERRGPDHPCATIVEDDRWSKLKDLKLG